MEPWGLETWDIETCGIEASGLETGGDETWGWEFVDIAVLAIHRCEQGRTRSESRLNPFCKCSEIGYALHFIIGQFYIEVVFEPSQ